MVTLPAMASPWSASPSSHRLISGFNDPSGHTTVQSEHFAQSVRPSSRRDDCFLSSSSPEPPLLDSSSLQLDSPPAAQRPRHVVLQNGVVFPSKVLQFHLSPAEQVQLQRSVAPVLSKRSNIIRTTAAHRTRNRRSVTFRKRNTPRPSSTFYCPPTPPIPDEHVASAMPLPEQNYIEAMERWRAQEEKLDEYRQKVAMTEKTVEQRHGTRSRRPSFRRALSLLPDSSGNTASAPPPVPSLPSQQAQVSAVPAACAITTAISSGRKSFSRKRSSAPAPPPDTRGPSHYYQDPEARRKLKLYLASPQKFQEAIEYGFPTTPNTNTTTSPQPTRKPSKRRTAERSKTRARASRDAQRFLHGNSLSFLDDSTSEDESDHDENDDDDDDDATDDDDEDDKHHDHDLASEPEVPSPVTPADSEALRSAVPRSAILGSIPYKSLGSSSRDQDIIDPDYVPEFSDVPWPPMREMTMRMTLTRPELRAREEEIYGFAQDDPLALQALPTMRDHTALGHRRSESGKVKTLWSKMKKPGKQRW